MWRICCDCSRPDNLMKTIKLSNSLPVNKNLSMTVSLFPTDLKLWGILKVKGERRTAGSQGCRGSLSPDATQETRLETHLVTNDR